MGKKKGSRGEESRKKKKDIETIRKKKGRERKTCFL